MKLSIKPVNSPARAEHLRVLRNECAAWMTRDTAQITRTRQRRFFDERLSTGEVEGFLAYDGDQAVAYGLLVPDVHGCLWSSTGVKETARGRGLGRLVTVENAKRAHAKGATIWAEVRQDNAGQQRICRTAGYEHVGSGDRNGVLVDVFRFDPPGPA